jgi:hypothetical protein
MIISRLLRVLYSGLKTNGKLAFSITSLCAVTLLFSFIPKADDPIDKLVSVLQRWTDSIPQEKVYLHMDKPYYAIGDTIWFKGYITIGSRHQLSALSGALYVDLINDKDSVIKDLKLPVTSGMVVGNFILGDEYNEGSYRIRAYTQWMRNAGPDYFFDRTFTVGDIGNRSVVTKADYQYKDIDGKQVLTALLNFTNDEGKAVAEQNIRYEIVIDKKTVWTQNTKTDALGSIKVNINNDNKVDLAGAYIRTTIDGIDKYPVVRDFPIKAALSQSDVQFFPESGSLVNGITSRIAFKAVGVDGLGVNVKGRITDETNNEVASFETLHAGMGSFMLRAQVGKIYKANITFADGTTRVIVLPKAADEGYTLGIYQPNKDSVLVRINASASLLKSPVNLIVQTNGESIFASPVRIEKAITSIWLNKKDFPTGIAQFTLFNNAGEPLNERIAFIRSNDQMQLMLKTNKTIYGSKERVQVDLEAKDSKGKPTAGNFSVSVIDESKVPVDENKESTIFSNLLLTSDLKGYVEQPNYYFGKETDEVNKALDNLMLTQGYRRFAWKDLLTSVNAKPQYKAEGLGINISGKVTTLTDKLLPNATVNLISPRAKLAEVTKTDAKGDFSFNGIFLTDSIKLTVQARGANNSDKVKLVLDSVPKLKMNRNPNLGDISTNIAQTLKTYIDNGKKLDDYYEQTGQLDKVHRLREVRIRANRKPPPPMYATQQNFRIPEGHSDHNYIMKDAERCANLAICLQGVFPGVIFTPYPKASVAGDYVVMRVVVDGRVLKQDEAEGVFDNTLLDPLEVVKIEVITKNEALKSMLATQFDGLGAAPVLLIYTNRGLLKKPNYNPSIANINPKGFNKMREFYQPRYDKPGKVIKLPDLRTSVYWNPYMKTNTGGKTTVNFFNADGPGNYKVIVEGINADGELGRQVYRYTVEAGLAETAPAALPGNDESLGMIANPLDNFNKRLPAEKVYLHTDKPYYNIGDTIWFKAYVTNADLTPTTISNLLYVEMNTDSAVMTDRISIRIKDGVAWGQMPLRKIQYSEGGYMLRAYTYWMKNFRTDFDFKQRLYLSPPSTDTWLVQSNAAITRVDDKDQLQVSLLLNRNDKQFSPVALKKVEVRIYDEGHYLFKEDMMTGIDGSLKFSGTLKDDMNGRQIRVQITALDKAENNRIIKVPLVITRSQKIDLQFLPEGGKLVAGQKSVIGFKAIGEDGKGTPASGCIIDSKGNTVINFNTLYSGMGAFEFVPQVNETYTARIEQPKGIIKTYAMPKTEPVGTILHISNAEDADELSVTLAGLNSTAADSAFYLVGTARGILYYSQKLAADQTLLSVTKKMFPTGIARFTLFKGKTPLNERAVFIDHHDQLSIKITPHKTAYNKRDSVSLGIEVKDKSGFPVQGSFSLAVTDDSQVMADSVGNFGIGAGLLINTDLKGDIESPGYYINRTDKNAWQALDNLMLTQGWTGYDWKTVFAQPRPAGFQPQKKLTITGSVTNILYKGVPNVPILISSQKPAFITTATTDKNGLFTFTPPQNIDTPSFFFQGNRANGKIRVFGALAVDRVSLYWPIRASTYPVLPWYVNSDSTRLNYARRRAEENNDANIKLIGIVLNEVKIKEKKIIKDSMNPYGAGEGDYIFDENDIKKSGLTNLYDFLVQNIPGIRIVGAHRTESLGYAPVLRFGSYSVDTPSIDGWPLTIDWDEKKSGYDRAIEEFSKIQLSSIKGIELAYSRKYTNRPIAAGGQLNQNFSRAGTFAKLEITTYGLLGWSKDFKGSTTTYRPWPITAPKVFYSPKYNVKPAIINPDYRATLHWEPNITTDVNGKATATFYTSDIKGKYTVKIVGINAQGYIGDSTIKLNPQ